MSLMEKTEFPFFNFPIFRCSRKEQAEHFFIVPEIRQLKKQLLFFNETNFVTQSLSKKAIGSFQSPTTVQFCCILLLKVMKILNQ